MISSLDVKQLRFEATRTFVKQMHHLITVVSMVKNQTRENKQSTKKCTLGESL